MSLKERITEDMKSAMRAKDTERLGAIRMLTAAMKQKEVDERVELDDAMVVGIVDKLIKQRKDSIEAYQKAERQDLADKEAAEMAVLQAYLPARLSADEIKAAVATLGWVAGNATEAEYQTVARLRLAGVLADQKKYDEALKQLDGAAGKEFEALVADRRGDVLLAQGKTEEAKAAYKKAWDTMDPKVEYRRLIDAKLTSLGAAPPAEVFDRVVVSAPCRC